MNFRWMIKLLDFIHFQRILYIDIHVRVLYIYIYVGRLISLVNFHEIALQSIWWCDISKNPLFEPLQAKFQPERTHSSRLVVIWSEIGAQKSALPSRQRAVPQVDRYNDKIMNWAMNWFLIHPTLRIWPRVTSFCSQT